MDDTLTRFATQTRQPPLSGATRTALARKWLALQLGGGAFALYSCVANDYGLIKHRVARSPQHFSNAAFVEMCAAGFKDAPPPHTLSAAPELQAFCDAIFPAPVGEEAWVPYHDPDGHWRARTYFLACQLPAVHADLVAAIHAYGRDAELCKTRAHRDAASDLYARINAYHLSHGPAPAAAVGALLKELHLGCQEPAEIREEEDEEQQGGPSDAKAMADYTKEQVRVRFVQAGAAPPPLENRTAAMHAYAKDALINATFCNTRLAKQMLLLQLGQPIDDLMSRNQIVPLMQSLAEPEVLEALAAPLADLPALNKESEAVRALYATCCEQPVTPGAFLRKALDVWGTEQGDATPLWKRQLIKAFPTVDASIVECFKAL